MDAVARAAARGDAVSHARPDRPGDPAPARAAGARPRRRPRPQARRHPQDAGRVRVLRRPLRGRDAARRHRPQPAPARPGARDRPVGGARAAGRARRADRGGRAGRASSTAWSSATSPCWPSTASATSASPSRSWRRTTRRPPAAPPRWSPSRTSRSRPSSIPERATESPPIHDDPPGSPHYRHDERPNVVRHIRLRHGDPDATGDVVVEGTYEIGMQDQAFLGTESGIAIPDGEGGIDIYVATQWLHTDREQVAPCLGLPEERVRLHLAGVGGAFGGREDLSIQVHAAMLALHTSRPVKMVYSREESFTGHVHRHPARLRLEHHATRDGRLVAVRGDVLIDGGAYASTSAVVIGNAVLHSCGPYRVPNVAVDGTAVYTNNPPCGAMRGFGAVQACFAYEAQMDRIAAELGARPRRAAADERARPRRRAADGRDHHGHAAGRRRDPPLRRPAAAGRRRAGPPPHALPRRRRQHRRRARALRVGRGLRRRVQEHRLLRGLRRLRGGARAPDAATASTSWPRCTSPARRSGRA